MGLFKKVEDTLGKGLDALGSFVKDVPQKTEGWGDKIDAWVADDEKWDDLKDKFSAAKEKAGETFEAAKEKAEEGFSKVFPEDTNPDEPQTEPTPADEFAEDVVEKVEEVLSPEVAEEAPVKADVADLSSLSVAELKELAKDRGVAGYSKLRKQELIDSLS